MKYKTPLTNPNNEKVYPYKNIQTRKIISTSPVQILLECRLIILLCCLSIELHTLTSPKSFCFHRGYILISRLSNHPLKSSNPLLGFSYLLFISRPHIRGGPKSISKLVMVYHVLSYLIQKDKKEKEKKRKGDNVEVPS
jgi:hypothetical protein